MTTHDGGRRRDGIGGDGPGNGQSDGGRAPSLRRPAVVAVTSAIAGAVCIGVAGGATTLWPVLLFALAGIVLLALSLLWVNDRLSDEIADGPTRRLAFLFLGLTLFGLGFLVVSVWWDSVVLGVIGTVTLACGFIGLHVLWKRQASESDGELVRLWFGVELIAGGIGVIWALDTFTAWAWLGLLVWFLGLIAVKQTMAATLAAGAVSVSRTIRISVDVAVAGFLALLGGATTSNQLAVMIGIAGVFVGCSLFGMALMYVRMDHRRAAVVTAAGLVVLVGGWAWARWVFGVSGLAGVLTALVAVVGAWFVFRGEAIILVVFVGFVAVWGLPDDPATVGADPNPGADRRILALGDSFISGEGATEYFEGTNRVGADRNECRRAPTAHPYLVAVHLEMGLDFVACSGATTADLLTCGQMAEGPDRCRPEELEEPGPDVPPGALPQLANLDEDELAEVDVVLLSIGGNDVGFSTIVQACLLPRSCNERAATWLANVEALGDTLVETYRAVRAAVPGAPVIVVPYPMLVDPEPCDLGLDRDEHRFVIDFIDALADRIEASVAEAGVHVYSAAREAFAGHRLCDDRPGANHLDLDPPDGSPTDRYLPATWIHNSMHPNPDGHRLLAFGSLTEVSGGLQAFVVERLAVAEADPAMANPEPVVVSAGGADGVGPPGEEVADVAVDEATDEATVAAGEAGVIEAEAEAAEALLSDGQWITDELYRTIRKLLLPTVLLLIGSITFAIGFVNLDLPGTRLVRPQRTWRLRDQA